MGRIPSSLIPSSFVLIKFNRSGIFFRVGMIFVLLSRGGTPDAILLDKR